MNLITAAILLNILALYGKCADIDTAPQNINTSSTAIPTPTTPITSPSPPPAPTSATTTTSTSSPTNATTPTTTTTSPTTPSPPTSTATPSPPTSTATPSPTTSIAPTTSTKAPTPSPPEPKQWEVINGTTGASCILLKIAVEIEVNYTNTANKTEETHLFLPTNASATGSCGDAKNSNESIKLSWTYQDGLVNTLEFLFSKNDNKFQLDAMNLVVTLDTWNFPSARDVNKTASFDHKGVEFATPVQMSYKCDKKQSLKLNQTNTTQTVGTITISEFQFQAFGNITKEHFAEARDCEPNETPDVVPIAVGCALMALIVIVLIGYLIGRRRNQARGYLSMFTENKKEADYIPMKNLSCFQ